MGKKKKLIGLLILLPIYWNLNTGAFAMELIVTGNGDGSVNETQITTQTTTNVTQTNSSDMTNDVQTNANTGGNEANGNSGEINITTGDANSDVNVSNQLNSSTVNNQDCCIDQINVGVSGNGSSSENSVNVSIDSETNIQVTQNASVNNNIKGFVNTGGNTANNNGGNVIIETGNAKVSGGIYNGPTNVSNVNSSRGVSTGLSVWLSGNGSGSVNLINANLNNKVDINVNEKAKFDNFVDWHANTGGNAANANEGDVIIKTGDSIIDFVIRNHANQSYIAYDGCCDDPEDPDPSPTPITTPTPTPSGDGGGNGGNGSNNGNNTGSSGGTGGGATVAAAAKVQVILGLSDTSSGSDSYMRTYLGYALILAGLLIVMPHYKRRLIHARRA